MEPVNPMNLDIPNHVEPGNAVGIAGNMDDLTNQVDEMYAKVEKVRRLFTQIAVVYYLFNSPSKPCILMKI